MKNPQCVSWLADGRTRRALALVLPFLLASLLALGLLVVLRVRLVLADSGPLTVEIGAAYNLVVDSNAGSPSTYAPSVATVMGRFCNTSPTQTLTAVQAFIGNYDVVDPGSSTPGVYPARDSQTFATEHPALLNTGVYSFVHLGGSLGTADAARYVGTLSPGECQVQYWHFTYPQCSNSEEPPCSGTPVWGDSVKPYDDLWLEFDIWATASGGYSEVATRRMTMRNEISAMANKIEPNGNPGGAWFNTKGDVIRAGEVVTSNGIRYELGNVRHGFDNDGDFAPDFNAWLQPVGNADYDPSCFRLIRTTGYLTITRGGGNPDMVIAFRDQLYFTNLPDDNTGVTGNVYYTFMALDGPCATALSPYQEVASGFDNEKFNADYGVAPPPATSQEPEVGIDKTGNLTATAGSRISYTVEVDNSSQTESAGLPLINMPLVVSDTIPVSTTFTGDFSASVGVEVLYSTDGGQTYTTTVPSPAGSVTTIQWWLTDTLGAQQTAVITFSVTVDGGFPPPGADPFIDNCADVRYGSGAAFDEDCHSTIISGTNQIGDWVWRDEDGDGFQDTEEASNGIAGVTVWLYYDRDGDGVLDSNDPLLQTTATDSGGYYLFDYLPDGDYLVKVDVADDDVPFGYNVTTVDTYSVLGLGTAFPSPYLYADFGFGPVLQLDKQLVSGDPAYEGDTIVYTIDLINTRPGDGTGNPSACTRTFTTWASSGDEVTPSTWQNPTYAFGTSELDGSYASSTYAGGDDRLRSGTITPALQVGDVVSVEVVYSAFMTQSTLLSGDHTWGRVFTDSVIDTDDWITRTEFSYAELQALEGAANQDLLVWDVTDMRSWTWSDFSNYHIELMTDKLANPDGATINVDAMGWRVTASYECGGPNDTIVTLPMTDTYDANLLQFVSATPAETSVATGGASPYADTGTLYWENLGPLYAGQTKVVTLTFTALEPSSDGVTNTTATVTNTAAVHNARYGNGRPVHSVTDTVTNTLLPTGSIGDTIWRDIVAGGYDPDGADDVLGTADDEVGIPGVVISLTADVTITVGGVAYPPYSTVTTTTDANGNYLFEGLRYSGRYTVTVDTSTLPGDSFTLTDDPDGVFDDQHDFDLNPTAAGGGDYLDADFGYQVPTLIDGTIWHDWNRNGASSPDPGEDWLTGVVVTLTIGTNTYTTTTDGDGYFQFTGNFAGTYTITVGTNSGDMAGADWTQSFDTDGHLATPDQSSGTVVTGGYGRADFSYYQTGTYDLGDVVWADWDGDGVQDGNEEGLQDVTVYLYEDSDGDGVLDAGADAIVLTATTTVTGYYLFESLPAGDYIVVVGEGDPDLPSDYVQTGDPDQPGVPCTSCDGRTGATIVASDVLTADFGYQPFGYGSIGDYVWRDEDGDGIQDAGESGISSVTVWLEVDLNGDGTYARIMTTTTDANGLYSFDGLPAASYRVVVDGTDADLPEDRFNTTYIASTPSVVYVTLSAGQDYEDADFGFAPPGAIGDTIYWDANRDGEQDWDEEGIDNVVVTLSNTSVITTADGTVYQPGTYQLNDTTDASGNYLFTGLPAGTYSVTVGTISGDPPLTGDPDTNGIPCHELEPGDFLYPFCDGQTSVDIEPGTVFLGADFGYQPSYVIGDYVWRDLDGDGVQDDGEPGISGVVITVTNGTSTYTTTTDLDGYYFFQDLSDDTWSVAFQPLVNMTPTLTSSYYITTGVGSVGLATTVVINGGVVTSVEGAACTDCSLHVDSGFQLYGTNSFGGHVFFDAGGTGDGTNDLFNSGTDTPYANITLYLWDDSGQLVGTTTTNASGVYTFTNLPTGVYTVSVDANSPQLNGMDLTASVNDGYTYSTVTLNTYGHDFGFYESIDFGDHLNDDYKTLLADEGAGHILGDLYLGINPPDAESDGQPTDSAIGDGADDADGVELFPNQDWTAGSTVNLTATVYGETGYLVAFFDWNGDGDFADGGERVLFGDVVSGTNTLTLTIPDSATPGNWIKSRFRLYDSTEYNIIGPTGLATNGEVEDYRWGFGPTAVELISFTATPVGDAILVEWETAVEIDSLGFNLYRATVAVGAARVQLNERLIPAEAVGSAFGARYEFVDTGVLEGGSTYYWLEEVDIYGVRTLYGPVVVGLEHWLYLPTVRR